MKTPGEGVVRNVDLGLFYLCPGIEGPLLQVLALVVVAGFLPLLG